MAETAQEKTEEPTARRLSKAREEGQVARSTELPAAAVVISTLLVLAMAGSWIITRVINQFASGFVFDRMTLDRPLMLPGIFADQMLVTFLIVLPVMIVTAIVAVGASAVTSGFHFSAKAVAPKFDKLNLFSGIKRIFGPGAAVELGKALLKFVLVACALLVSVSMRMHELMHIGEMALEPALATAGKVIVESTLAVSLTLLLIAAIDVPYQRYTYFKGLRMTRQEIKDEMQEMEGRPEVKAHIRKRQREMATARMMQRVKDADVVITNPEHFAVALEYDPSGDGAPVVVAKGSDFMAAQIREEAARHGVHLFPAPELARALYFTTEPEQSIPEALYHAVAQVIAYVFSLEGAQPGRAGMQRPSPKVPASMRYDASGQRLDQAQPAF